MTVALGLCGPWITEDDMLSCAEPAGLDIDQAGQVAVFASEVLYVLTNQQWPGVCLRTVRPWHDTRWAYYCTPNPHGSALPAWGYTPGADPWIYTTVPAASRFELPLPGPIQTVSEVMVDGVVVPDTAYIIIGKRRVQRIDGGIWPIGQDLTRPPGVIPDVPSADGTAAWSVTYEWGAGPPASGVIACRSFYCEIVAALSGADCKLPWTGAITTVQRRGTTINYGALHDQFEKGYVGLADVDLWINSARGGPWRPRPPRIVRADDPARQQRSLTTWPD